MRYIIFYIIIFLCFSCHSEKSTELCTTEEARTVFNKNIYSSKADDFITFPSTVDLNDIEISISGLIGITQLNPLVQNSSIRIASIFENVRFNAGFYTLYASLNGHVVDKTSLQLYPKAIKGQSTNYVGPKTTSFNDSEGSMITGYFEDEHHNLVDTTLLLRYQIQSNTTKNVKDIMTDHDYYFTHTIPSKNNIRQLVGVSSGNEYSEEITVIGSSGCPQSATISISDRYNIADGHQIFNVNINDILDEDSNVVSSGTDLQLIIESSNYISQYGGVVINGSATFIILNPSVPGDYSLSILSCNRVIARKNNLFFKPVINSIPYTIKEKKIIVGPLLSQLKQSLPDGSIVNIYSEQCPEKKGLSSKTRNGLAVFDKEDILENCDSPAHTIIINGVQRELLLTNKSNNDS